MVGVNGVLSVLGKGVWYSSMWDCGFVPIKVLSELLTIAFLLFQKIHPKLLRSLYHTLISSMASNPDVIGADAGDLELEAMRKDDCSWHPCQVHFSPDDAALVIEYGNNGSQDTLVSEKEALMRIRVRSLPLQDGDCIHIKPGEHVVVNRNSQPEGGFFDAEVEKVLRVRHSKRTQCRCTFMIRWLHQDLNGGSLTVPSSSVMRLANKSINNHPTISAFMDEMLLCNSNFSSMSPQLTVVNAIDLEFHDLLEKQIEGIRNSVHCSKKKIRNEILGLEANTNEQIKGTDIFVPDVREPEQISTDMSHLRRSNWSQEVSQIAEVNNSSSPVIPSPSTAELPDNRSPLNPLAARAALASMMSKLPQSLEISLNEEERKGLTDEEGKALKSTILAHYSSSGIDDFFDKLSSETEVTTKPIKIVKKPLFSGHSKAEGSDFSTNVTHPRQDKMNPATGTRLTRATVKKVKGIPDDNIERSSRIDGNKLSTATNRRFTRSALCAEGERETVETISVVEKHMSTRCEEYITSDHKVKADGSHTSEDEKTLFTTPLPVAENDSKSNARRKILSKMEEGNKGIGIEGTTCTVDTKNSSNMRRLTRSMQNKEATNIKTGTTKESGDDEFPKNEALSGGTDGILDVKMLKTTKAINSPFSADISLSPAEGNKKRAMSGGAKTRENTDSKFINASVDLLLTEQRNKKRNMSGGASATQDSEGNVTSDGGRSYGSKKKSLDLKKQKVRSSPRFLSKT
ncbi:hypothetical protein L6452_03841 [Arctium lappa]|uniref:Uncharacterized protein n=1 Tax=Arctium lappa TaxID=4217 RepID=A0ACB9FP94_ARCLA|nr:hypothetical protein L6452_03841 [Arctium lappa]